VPKRLGSGSAAMADDRRAHQPHRGDFVASTTAVLVCIAPGIGAPPMELQRNFTSLKSMVTINMSRMGRRSGPRV
jgi:hypothetical protein